MKLIPRDTEIWKMHQSKLTFNSIQTMYHFEDMCIKIYNLLASTKYDTSTHDLISITEKLCQMSEIV